MNLHFPVKLKYSEERGGKNNYLVRFSFTRFSVRMTIVSCKYFISGDAAWKNGTLTQYISAVAENTTDTRIKENQY